MKQLLTIIILAALFALALPALAEDEECPIEERSARGYCPDDQYVDHPDDLEDIPDRGLTPLPRLVPATPIAEPVDTETVVELPFTGPADGLLPVGVGLILAGAVVLGFGRLTMKEKQ